MGDGLKRARAAATAYRIAGQVTEALHAAGHVEAGTDRTGYFAIISDGRVIVFLAIDAHAEGHFDSPAHHAMQKSAADEYRQVLEAAGWAVSVHPSGEALTVTGRARAAQS
jgi:hypothetical protein